MRGLESPYKGGGGLEKGLEASPPLVRFSPSLVFLQCCETRRWGLRSHYDPEGIQALDHEFVRDAGVAEDHHPELAHVILMEHVQLEILLLLATKGVGLGAAYEGVQGGCPGEGVAGISNRDPLPHLLMDGRGYMW